MPPKPRPRQQRDPAPWKGARGASKCPGCGAPRARKGSRHLSANRCPNCGDQRPAVWVLAANQTVEHPVLLAVGVRPWKGARGHWECAGCRLMRQLTDAQVNQPPPCPGCRKPVPVRFFLAAQGRRPGQQPASKAPARPKTSRKQRIADAAATMLTDMRAERLLAADRRRLIERADAEIPVVGAAPAAPRTRSDQTKSQRKAQRRAHQKALDRHSELRRKRTSQVEARALDLARRKVRVDPATIDADLLDDQHDAATVVDLYVSRHCFDELCETANHALGLPREGFGTSHVKGGLLVSRGETNLLLVRATTVRFLLLKQSVKGNFLAPGTHWSQITSLLPRRTTVAAPPPEPPQPAGRWVTVTDWPGELADRMRRELERVSALIREQRQLAFGHAILVHLDDGRRLRLDPVDRVEGALGLPFTYHPAKAGAALKGILRVASPNPLLPVAVPADQPGQHLAAAWRAVLTVFADLTTNTTSSGRGAPTVPHTFKPTAHTARVLDHYVIGHKRQISPRSSASDQQRHLAAAAGITLPPRGITWVRPHTRGTPPDRPLEFHWHGRL